MSLLSLPPFAALSSARQRALYSDFTPQRTSNPPGFKANVAWWSALLVLASELALEEGDKRAEGADDGLVLSVGEELVESLRMPGGGRPLALGTVIEEMLTSSTLVPTSTYLSSSSAAPSTTGSSSTASLPLRVASTLLVTPLVWSFRQLGLGGGSSASESGEGERALARVQGEYVVKPTLEKLVRQTSEKIKQHTHSLLSESLFTPTSFSQTFASHLSARSRSILLAELERGRMLVRSKDGEVIRLLDGPADKREVGDVERGVLDMRSTIETLRAQIAELEQRAAERSEQAKVALGKGQKGLALGYLRARKELEAVLDKRVGSLGTLEGVLLKVDSSAGDVAILKAYETSTTTLRSLLALPELQLSSVEQTTDALAAALADQDEIERAVHAPLAGEADEDGLEEELAALVAAGERSDEKVRDAQALEARLQAREAARSQSAAARVQDELTTREEQGGESRSVAVKAERVPLAA